LPVPVRDDQIYARFSVRLRDGNDTARVHTPGEHEIFDGAGDDVVIGGNGPTVFQNFTGRDDLWGGGGTDEYRSYADEGNSFQYYMRDMWVSLDNVPNDGFEGGRKNVHGDIENVVLGGGDNVIEGNWRANHLSTAGGADYIAGGAGQDVLETFWGDDTIDATDGERDHVDCGRGTDAATVDAIDIIVSSPPVYPDSGCENVTLRG
jgi:hypothetical protein